MAIVAPKRTTTRRRTVVYSLAAGVAVLFLVAGLLFVNSASVTRVTNNARSLHWVNATLGTGALARAGLAQAITFSDLARTGEVTQDDLDFVLEQVGLSAEEMSSLLEAGGDLNSYPAALRFVGSLEAALAALETGDLPGARSLATGEVESSYQEMTLSLQGDQATIQQAIDQHSESGRSLNGWITFVLTLMVPGAAVVVYFSIARRQVRAYREKAELEIEAERTISRAKDAFIAGLSHELRTPLTSIYGFAEVLSDGSVSGAEATQEAAQVIANEAAEMTRMVDDLLVASRLESTGVGIDLAPTPVHGVVESAITPFERAGGQVAREPTTAMALADAARLRHVLVNLLSNAFRHGGAHVGVSVTSDGQQVGIEVWDDGPGVSDDQLVRMFDRFVHQGDEPLLTGSVGLGLAVASRLTDLMGGGLQYQRYNGKSYFVASLPVPTVVEDDLEDTATVAEMIKALSA